MLQDGQRTAAIKKMREFMQVMEMDIESDGMKDTPRRIVDFFDKWMNPEPIKWTEFESTNTEPVKVTDITVFSMCEHHNEVAEGATRQVLPRQE